MVRSHIWTLLSIGVTAAVMGSVWAATSGEVEVRVHARHLEDGRVEVGVQQRNGNEWSDLHRPSSRFIPADAAVNRWYRSGSVTVSLPDAGSGAEIEEVADVSSDDLYCMVTHGRPGDEAFWVNLFAVAAQRWDVYHDGISVAVKHGATSVRQAQLIRECVDEGAVVIGTSLPDPDALSDALLEVHEAGIPIVTFNSGLLDFASVKSRRHVSVDEVAAGERAAQRLVEGEIRGVVLCVIHEARNIGLDERCDGLEAAYANGLVERMHVTGVGNLEATTSEISTRLLSDQEDSEVGAVLTLNTEIAMAALDAIEQTEADVALATFDQTRDVLEAIADGRIMFAINTNPSFQSWYALSSMLFLAKSEPRLRQIYGLDDPTKFIGQFPILIAAGIYSAENVGFWLNFTRAIEQGAAEREIDRE